MRKSINNTIVKDEGLSVSKQMSFFDVRSLLVLSLCDEGSNLQLGSIPREEEGQNSVMDSPS